MRHRKSFNHLSRKAPHRKAMLANMAASLIMEKRITTTTAKAKALRSYVEPLITKSKDDTTHSRRVVFSYLQDKDAVSELFREVSPKVMERAGGYTRILKLDQNRLGDNAEMALIELVDFNPNLITETKDTTGGGTRRRRRGGSKNKSESKTTAETTSESKKDASDSKEEADNIKGETNQQTESVAAERLSETEVKDPEEADEGKKDEEPKAQSSSEEDPKADASEEKPDGEEKRDDTEEEKKDS